MSCPPSTATGLRRPDWGGSHVHASHGATSLGTNMQEGTANPLQHQLCSGDSSGNTLESSSMPCASVGQAESPVSAVTPHHGARLPQWREHPAWAARVPSPSSTNVSATSPVPPEQGTSQQRERHPKGPGHKGQGSSSLSVPAPLRLHPGTGRTEPAALQTPACLQPAAVCNRGHDSSLRSRVWGAQKGSRAGSPEKPEPSSAKNVLLGSPASG